MASCTTEYRCKTCHTLFFKGLLVEGSIDIKCKRCHTLQTIQASDANPLLCLIKHCPNRISWDTPSKHA